MMASLISFTTSEVSKYYAARIPSLKQRRAAEWRGPCVIHDGIDDNFAVNAETGQAYCHSQCARGWDIIGFEQALSGADFKTAKAEVFSIVGRDDSPNAANRSERRIIAEYAYTNEHGNLLYQVVRYEPKGFAQRYPEGEHLIWKKHRNQVRYHLDEVLGNHVVLVCEGEKDADRLRSYGLTATTAAGGCGAPWLDSFSETLRGKKVIIFPDNDIPGWKRAQTVARALIGIAASVHIFDVPKRARDVSDWLDQVEPESEIISKLEDNNV
jgi:DNA primase